MPRGVNLRFKKPEAHRPGSEALIIHFSRLVRYASLTQAKYNMNKLNIEYEFLCSLLVLKISKLQIRNIQICVKNKLDTKDLIMWHLRTLN